MPERETRYLVADVSSVGAALSYWAEPRSYRVHTRYLAFASGGAPKLRLREYDESEVVWLEVKQRKNGKRRKWRAELLDSSVTPLPVLYATRYQRDEFVLSDDLRVTVDDNVAYYDADDDYMMTTPESVVEVKTTTEIPEWLASRLPAPSAFSKSRMAAWCVANRVRQVVGGEVWSSVHDKTLCQGGACVVHDPSEHHMRLWPMHLREHGLVERICQHGVGHPDPDSLAYFTEKGRGSFGVHGCDSCCRATVGVEARRAAA